MARGHAHADWGPGMSAIPHQYRDEILAAEVTRPHKGQRLVTVAIRRVYEKEISHIQVDPWMLTAQARAAIAFTQPSPPEPADQLPALLKLAQQVARLNPDAGEIGAGMLASLVADARRIVNGGTQ